MKKFLFFVLCLFTIVFISGCGNNNIKVLRCSGTNRGNNMSAQGEYVYKFKNDKLIKLNAIVTFKDITVDNLSSVWDSVKAQFNEQNYPTEEKGYKRTTKADDKNYTFTVILDIDYEKISKESMKKFEISEDTTKKTYEEIKKESIESSMTCK